MGRKVISETEELASQAGPEQPALSGGVSDSSIEPADASPAFFPSPRQLSAARRHLANLPMYACFLASAAARKLGLQRDVDGWRRATGVGLRCEASKFALASFGLDLWSDDPSAADAPPLTVERAQEHFMLRFAGFLRSEPLGRLEMVHERSVSYAVSRRQVDVTLAEFSPSGELRSVRPFLDSTLTTPKPREEVVRDRILPALLNSFNEQRTKWDERPPAVSDYVAPELDGSPAAPGAARAYLKRALGATFVSFDPMPSDIREPCRFIAPSFQLRRGPGFGALNVVCRLSHDGRAADVWVQVHHAATDGVPVQEMLSRLQRMWGIARGHDIYPSAGAFAEFGPRNCSAPNPARRVSLVQEFLDFTPLLDLRQLLNKQPLLQTAGGVTVAALVIWSLAHQRTFAGKKFSLACESSGPGDRAAGVGLLSIRPGEYFGAFNKAAAFAAFVHEFNRLLNLTRARTSPTCRALDGAAILPPAMHAYALRVNAAEVATTFGTVGLSILREAKVFIPPFADRGFEDGFISIGDMTLRASNGARVGAVSIKGASKQIAQYPDTIKRAIENGSDYV